MDSLRRRLVVRFSGVGACCHVNAAENSFFVKQDDYCLGCCPVLLFLAEEEIK